MTDDQTLLAGLQSGRHDAANALYDTYGASIYAFAWRRTGDPHLSREIVQDVMTNVWRSALTFDPDPKLVRMVELPETADTGALNNKLYDLLT